MKKLYIPMMLMAIAAIASCEKQSVEKNEPATGTYIYTMKASVPEDMEVKSDYDASGNFTWSSGDAISVLFHNGDDNKFFTLTTTGTGKNASFSGSVTDGYTIGASDGSVADKRIFVLYPASTSHSYSAGDAYPTFYTPAEVDFTAPGSHYSANLPMYALLADEGDISFDYIASAYKFIVTDLDASVNKVKFVVSNQKTHGLSGSFPITYDGSVLLNYGWTGEGAPGRSLTFIANKEGSSASFYVPCRWYGNFQPEITIFNAENNYTLKHVVATKNQIPSSMTTVKPITISAPGTGSAPASIDVDWSGISAIAGINDRIVEWKTTSDVNKIYFYYKFTKAKFKSNGSSSFYIGFDKDSNSATGSTSSNGGATTGGIEAMAYFYPWTGGSADGAPDGVVDGEDATSYVQAPVGTTAAGIKVLIKGSMDSTYVYIEIAIPRTALGISAGDTVTVITAAQNYKTSAESVTY